MLSILNRDCHSKNFTSAPLRFFGKLTFVQDMKSFAPLRELLGDSRTFYLISVGMDSTYVYLNAHYREKFEPQHGDLIGKHYAVTMHREDTHICAEVSAKCFNNPGQGFPATIRKYDGHGGYVATQWDYKATFDENGKPSGIFCIGYDITKFVRTAMELEKMEYIQSHVIRKPIANLMGLVKLLEEVDDREMYQKLVGMIRVSADELDKVINPRQ